MSFMLQVQQGKIENKKTKNDNNNENHEKTRKETGKKKEEVFGTWITYILFQLICANGLLNLFVKKICSKSTVIIIVLHILLRHFHSERSISIMTALFCFTREAI